MHSCGMTPDHGPPRRLELPRPGEAVTPGDLYRPSSMCPCGRAPKVRKGLFRRRMLGCEGCEAESFRLYNMVIRETLDLMVAGSMMDRAAQADSLERIINRIRGGKVVSRELEP